MRYQEGDSRAGAAPDVAAAKAVAAVQFDLDDVQRNRFMVQETG
jgi:hypothetical protein